MDSRAEARRKKILQNSEERLKKLTGRSDFSDISRNNEDTVSNDDHLSDRIRNKWESEGIQSGNERDNRDDFIEKEAESESDLIGDEGSGDGQQYVDHCAGEHAETDRLSHQQTSTIHTDSPQKTRSAQRLTNRALHTTTGTVPGGNLKSMSDSSEASTGTATASTESSQNMAEVVRQIEKTRLFCCITMGLFSRWLVSSLLGYLFLQSAALMFLAMEAALFAHQKNILQDVVLPHRSNLMVGALVLCGIKPELITVYNRIMGIASTFFEDLMLFFFTFITCHILVS